MIPFLDLKKINQRREVRDALLKVLDSGWYILGQEVAAFEKEFAAYCGAKQCVSVANGLEALSLVLRAWKEMGKLQDGDEVIVPSNTFIATVLAVTANDLTPVFVEPDLETHCLNPNLLRAKISKRTRVILPVHLYGRLTPMAEILRIAGESGLLVLEDSAQSHGAEQDGRVAGNFGDAAGFSFYPGKNLGALGDGGAITTNDSALGEVLFNLRNYGAVEKYHFTRKGQNCRLDEIQAAVLRIKLKFLSEDNTRRRAVATRYLKEIRNPNVILPTGGAEASNVWHLFVVRCEKRAELQAHLKQSGVETIIHYPIPPHKQKAFEEFAHLQLPLAEQLAREVLSLPISQVMSENEITHVVAAVNSFRS